MNELIHVITDAVDQYNKVAMVTQFVNLTRYEQSFQSFIQHSEELKKILEAMEDYQNMKQSGVLYNVGLQF